MERIDDLGLCGFKIIQDTDSFCFGTDAVLLADFATVKPGAKVVDLCAGNGVIPLLLCGKTKADLIYGVELMEPSYQLAVRSVALNHLEDRIQMLCCDAKTCADVIGRGTAETVTCNPPYMNCEWGYQSPIDAKAAARHELFITLDEVVRAAASLLKFGGYFAMVHRSERLCDIITSMRQNRIEPKRIRFVHARVGNAPKLLLIEGILGAKPSLRILNPLYLYDASGNYTEEVKRLYGGGENEV